ncbi:hypothetical protein C8K18_115152 [Paraburkholderia sp. GV068]|nr:hypothetical protein C8K19_1151 [Paraburkholderia sp. GV072]PUB00602.1 hypothetical protein C8K18_115152 [Paraburkholderia sp. GV068]
MQLLTDQLPQSAKRCDGLNGGYTTTTQNVGSALTTGGSLTTVSGHDTTLVDATVKAGGNVTMPSVNNLLRNEGVRRRRRLPLCRICRRNFFQPM